jgi:3-deoxy-D-manno-octulosonic-acid transferase
MVEPWFRFHKRVIIPAVLLYRFLSAVGLALYAPYALLLSVTGRRKLGDLRGRLGRSAYPDLDGGIWIHAVSVGEVAAARAILRELSALCGGRRLGLSVTTAAGRALAESTCGGVARVFAFPFDLQGPVERALSGVRPGLILLTETELWPLFLARARGRGIPVVLVNGRLSDRSFPRYRRARRFLSRAFSGIALFLMQSRVDAERARAIGAPPERIRVCGNVKYDVAPAPPFADSNRLGALRAGRPLLVAASTAEGEEEAVLEAFRPLEGRALLAVAPRRPERFDAVAALIDRSGYCAVRRSVPGGSSITRSPVYLLDSVGELASLYRGALLAFVGGSLVPTGGHNPIEAWAEGVPVVVGPHTQNFREAMSEGERRGFLERVEDEGGLARAFAGALDEPKAAADRGRLAREFVAESRGAARATAEAAIALLGEPSARRAAP